MFYLIFRSFAIIISLYFSDRQIPAFVSDTFRHVFTHATPVPKSAVISGLCDVVSDSRVASSGVDQPGVQPVIKAGYGNGIDQECSL